MKKILCIFAIILSLVCLFVSCDQQPETPKEPTIEVSDDGYLVVNGKKTEHKVQTENEEETNKTDEITVEDGYLVVNGVKTEYGVENSVVVTVEDGYVVVNGNKTEHKVHTEPVISVIDGYVAVNGVKTEYKVDTADVITVENGYVVVNGVTTEHKVHTDPVISVIDGYVAVNGVKTEYKVDTADVIEVNANGYLIVNGVKTEYMVTKDCVHIWKTVTTPATCQAGGYDTKTCQTCGKVEVCNETPLADHTFEATYTTDNSYHWYKCQLCNAITSNAEHTDDGSGNCTICDYPIGPTEGVLYDVSADGTYAEVIGYTGSATKVRIAEKYQGLPVTTICKEAFKSNTTIISVIIPNSVTTIGEKAFSDCSNLTSVTIGDSVTTIGSYAFQSCSNLTSVTIPDLVTTIGGYAFYWCTNLTSVTIGDSVTTIGERAFQGCFKLTSFVVDENNTAYQSINGNLYSKDGTVLVAYARGKTDTSFVVPNSVTTIGYSAFHYCSKLTSVTIGDSVTTIGDSAFWCCTNLTSVTIGDSVTTIGDDAFYNCNSALYTEYQLGKYIGDSTNPYAVLIEVTNKNMSTYTIHPDTKIIANGVFSGCERLTSIAIPNGVRGIGNSAFAYCSNLTSVTIGDSVTTIGDWAFSGCSHLTSVTIGDSVTTIGDCAFYDCYKLTSVTFANPNGWECEYYYNATSVIAISASDLSNPETAAQYLKSNYSWYYWYRTE